MRTPAVVLALLATGCTTRKEPPAAYVAAGTCEPCHQAIANTYRQVAMARSLYRPAAANVIEDYTRHNRFYHRPSDRYYEMIRRDGKFFQRRYRLDERREPVRVLEQEVSYIIGSGNHARSYLHLSATGELTQLPITWYSQEQRWGMSPGYDKERHHDFSRQIDHGCLFCHNAYPHIPAGAARYAVEPRFPQELPHGIDCQRCHGPGSRHVEVASSGSAAPDRIRGTIVNPARLSPERQMDVCQQCHLETTSAKLPQAVRRFGRAAYSFRPGERLSDYLVHFDYPPGRGYDDKFEIVGAAYRLRKSACFQKSGGRLTCITCHNPHRTPRGEESVAWFRERCVKCHASLPAPHPAPATSNCVGCHMPERRTDDVVHVTMTDHLIQRRKPERDLLAARSEAEVAYRGDLVLYDPPELPQPQRDLYFGIALATEGVDRKRGIELLQRAIERAPLEAHVELATALMAEGNPSPAAGHYRKALAIDPSLVKIRYNFGRALEQAGDSQGAIEQYEQAVREDPNFPEAHNNLATLLARRGERERAIEHFRQALRARPWNAEAHINLGNLYTEQGRLPEAREEIEQALRDDPDFAEAWNSLGRALGIEGRMDRAADAFARATRIEPGYAEARFNLGRALHVLGKRDAAIVEYRRALETNPQLAEARLSLGVALGEKSQWDAAIEEFRATLRLRPDHAEARKNLQVALEMRGQRNTYK